MNLALRRLESSTPKNLAQPYHCSVKYVMQQWTNSCQNFSFLVYVNNVLERLHAGSISCVMRPSDAIDLESPLFPRKLSNIINCNHTLLK